MVKKENAVNNGRERDGKIMAETEKFRSRGSEEALKFFTGKCPMTQEGFEICVREMIQFGYTTLYMDFTEKNTAFLKEFNRKIDLLESESRKNMLSDGEKQKMWNAILEKIEKIDV